MRYLFIIFLLTRAFCIQAQIDLQTGSAQYSIPIFNYSDPKSGLSHAIAVNYTSGQGIKVNQLSSNIGLGWSLMAGGEILRIQHGNAPDDQYNPDASVNGLTAAQAQYLIYKKDNLTLYNAYFPNGFLYKKYDINTVPKYIGFQPRFNDNDSTKYKAPPAAGEDTEQDMFLVNINGNVRTFKIGKDFSIKYEDNTLWKTEITKEDLSDHTLYDQNIITKIKGFTITDETGIKYTFDKYDLDELQQATEVISGWRSGALPNTYVEKGNGKYAISKWLLTSVTNPITNTSITFSYTQEDRQYFTDFLDQATKDAGDQSSNPSYSYTRIIGNSHTKSNILQQIAFPNGVKAIFTMGTVARLDVNGSYPVSKIEIGNGIRILKTVTFNTAYLKGSGIESGTGVASVKRDETYSLTIEDVYRYRLVLNSLAITGASPASYTFNYYVGTVNSINYSVPSRMNKQRNFSGLYNPLYGVVGGATTPDWYGKYPADNGNTEITGLLREIQSSTNSKISYTYKFCVLVNGSLSGVLVHRITTTDLVTNTSYTKEYGYCDSGTDNCNPNNDPAATAKQAFYDVPGGQHYTGYLGSNSETKHVLYNPSSKKKFGTYVYHGVSSQVTSFLRNPIAAYQLNAAITGALECNPYVALAIQIIGQEVMNILTEWLADVFSNHDQNLNSLTYYDHLREQANPLPITMASVNEYDVVNNNLTLRKSYYYNTAWLWHKLTDGGNYPVQPYTASGMQRVKPGLLGNLAEVDFFDPQQNVVYKKTITYAPNYQTADNNFLSVYYSTADYYSGSWDLTPTPYLSGGAVDDQWIKKTTYNFVTGNNYLASQTESVANSGNSANTTTTMNYAYDAKNNQPNQLYSTASDGKIKGTNTYYAIDYWSTYTSNTTLMNQKLYNMVNIPVASLTWYKSSAAATSYNVTGITITTYDATTLGVSSVKTSLLSQPLVLTQADITGFDPYATTGWLTGVSFTTVQQNTYDNNYFLVQTNYNDNTTVSATVYDYNTNLPSAKIINSTYTDVSYTSFESPNKDLLTYADAGVTNDPSVSVTGNSYYKLSAGSITRSTALSSAQKYTVTLWARGGSVTVNGSAGTSLTAKNGWTLYTYTLSGTTSLTIAPVAGNSTTYVDEVRLYPQSAQLVSYTYDALVGVTSSCDENNNIIYNEYDDAGRLIIVRNADKNIVKRLCYNSTGTSTACNDNGNAFQSKDFYATCSCGQKSNPVTYSVPADKYHSFTSQEDADAQAWSEINANGQSYANSHPSCSSSSSTTFSYDNTQTNSFFNISIYNTCNSSSVSTPGINPHSGGPLASLPPGEYNISVSAISGDNSKYDFTIGSPYLFQGNASSASFSGVQFTSSTTLTIKLSK